MTNESKPEDAAADAAAKLDTIKKAAAAPPAYLSRESIANADDHREVDVHVPEWNGTVRVKGLTGTERDRFESSILTFDAKGNRRMTTDMMRAKLVVLAVVHPPGHPNAGQRVFDDTDVGWLSEKSAAAVDRVFSEAQKLAGLSDDDMAELESKLGEAPAASTTA